ncbi:transposase [Paraburkholderia sp.]|uniref:transposase n=1 Tax=Paraburkholderia sp. TaxID=1926495 RepID=UPI0039E4C2EF
MKMEANEFMRRFLLHVLPVGFHRLRHGGLLANPVRRATLVKVRELLHITAPVNTSPEETLVETWPAFICRHCGAPLIVIDILARTAPIRAPATLGRLGRRDILSMMTARYGLQKAFMHETLKQLSIGWRQGVAPSTGKNHL